ncbi:uncharacterized protein LOC118199281 isoform X2 [Stegodyphus dumicola]|uniref:uncharacterized protein LOC118199281 isoform X2 n=1 Tax=Stegodyphus dumicola TaxID=202533 RepID=UPI0015AE75C0|nr:uncharacterized protein LOC118199281 isoform X2 [Stegodyphus dumicola]
MSVNNIEVITLSSSDEDTQSKKDTAEKCMEKENTDSPLIDSATSKVESSPQKFTARKSLTNMLADDIQSHISVSQIATKLFPKFTARKSLVNGNNSSKKKKNHVSVSQHRQNNARKSLTSNSSKHVQNCKSISESRDLCTAKYDASIPVTSTPKPNKPEKPASGSLVTFQSKKLCSENSEVPCKDSCMKAKHKIKQTLNPMVRNHNTEVNSVQHASATVSSLLNHQKSGVKISAVSQKKLCASPQALRTVVGEEAKALPKTVHSLSVVNSVHSKKNSESEIKESAQNTVVLNGKQTSLTHSKKHIIPKSLKNDLTSRGVSIFNAVQKTRIELPCSNTSNFKSSEPNTEVSKIKSHEMLQGISNLEKGGLSIQLINNRSASSRESSNCNYREHINDKSSGLDSTNKDAKAPHKNFKSSTSVSGTGVKANSLNNNHSKILTFKDPKECQALLNKVNQKNCHKKKRSFHFEGLLITPVSKGKNNSSNDKIPESYENLSFPSKRKSDLENTNVKSKKSSIKILSVESLADKTNSLLGNTDCKEPEFLVDSSKTLSPDEIINVNKFAEISAASNKNTQPASDLPQLNSEENDKSKILSDMYDSKTFSSLETRALAETSSKSNFTISSKESLNCVALKDADAEEMKSFITETKENGTKDLHVKETLPIDALLSRFESSSIKVVNKNLNHQGSSSIQKNVCTGAQKDELAVSEGIQEAKAVKVGTVTLVKENSSKDVHVEALHEALNSVDRVRAIDEIKSSHSEGQRSSFEAISTKLSLERKKSSSALDIEDDTKECINNPATSTKLSLKRKRSTSDVEDDPRKCITNPNNVLCNGKLVAEQKKKEPTENSCKFPVDNKGKFVKLLEFCKPYMKLTEDEEKKIQNNLLKHLNYAHQNFVISNEFSDLITLTRENIIKDSDKVFVHLNYLQLELKAHKQKKNINSAADHKSTAEAIKINASNQNSSSVSLDQYGNKISSSTSNNFTEVGQNLQKNLIIESEKPDCSTTKEIFIELSTSEQDRSRNFSAVSEISNFQADTSKEQKNNKSDSKNSKLDADARQELQVKRLERLLHHLDKKIRKLQTKELSLEDLDDEDSTYIMEDKYKQKFNKVWNELCKIKQRSRRTGREMEKTFKYEGSRYTCLNHAVEKMINKRKPSEKFPNYIEIYKLVKNINDTEFLGLDEPFVTKLAKKVFQDVVLELKARRERDDEQVLGCYLTDNIDLANDPAEHDETLKEKLSLSIAAGEKRIAEIIDKYAEKQPEASELESDDEHSEKETDVSKKIETVISDSNIKKVDVGTDLQKMPAEVRLSEGFEYNNQETMELIKSTDLPDTDPNSSGSDEFPSLKKQGIVCNEMVYISSDASTEPDCNSGDLKCSSDLKRDNMQNYKSALSEKLTHSNEAMQPVVVKDLKSALSEKLKHTKETKQPVVINEESDSSSDLPSPEQLLQSS